MTHDEDSPAPNEEDVLDDTESESTPFKYEITAYGADYPVDGLVKRLKTGDIIIPTFQRGYVWPRTKAMRFIESLLLGLPVPGIFLSKEPDTGKLLVIDGQQRLKTLQYFYEGTLGERKFRLQDVALQFVGRTYAELEPEDRRALDDSILHATIVQQTLPEGDQSSIFHIFERLNTGGVLLQAQEIRACIHHGEFSDLLAALNKNSQWRAIYGPVSPRMKDQELILRFIALFLDRTTYDRPMKDFLNTFMDRNKRLALHSREELSMLFASTVDCVSDSLGARPFRPERSLNAAVYDAVMVGIAARLTKSPRPDREKVSFAYQELLKNNDFQEHTKRSTADKAAVLRRLSLAIDAFERT